jgi:hypothetical protein
MTKKELKDYLNTSYNEIENLKLNIRSLEYYEQRTVAFFPDYLRKEQTRKIDGYISEDRKRLERRIGQITSWSNLIHNETHRQIFIDHYINGLKWSVIEDKYHYSRSRVFEINKKCCNEIARNLVCDIAPKQTQQAVTM